MTTTPPAARPARPHFSSGPCAKRPGWSPDHLKLDSLGRSHRSKLGKARLKLALDMSRKLLGLPDSHLIGIVAASDTGAVEMAMWSLLGPRPVTVAAWETFGEDWVTDAVKQLKLNPTVLRAPYGELPPVMEADQSHDIILTWNGTTAGARVPHGDWIRDDREGLIIADATSAVFACDMPWDKVDVVTYSWQKVMGGEAAHGILILGPRAVERLESHTPTWPVPKLFRMTKGGKLNAGIFEGETINTPSMLCVEDCIDGLEWAESIGGLPALIARSNRSAAVLDAWVQRTPWIDHLVAVPEHRANTGVCLVVTDPAHRETAPKAIADLLERESVAFDINNHRAAPPSLRIWCGATVDPEDVEALIPWLEWAYAEVTAEAAIAA